VTLVETIIADRTTIPPMIIVQGKLHMTSWQAGLKDKKTLFHVSDTGFINIDIAMDYLDHLIKHTNAGEDSPLKILLMDRHGSHTSPEFILKATNARIIPFPFPGHLTHVLQPLDVAVFQPYKHWHKKAVQHAIRNLDVEYTVSSFIRDLDDIRVETFKPTTIFGAFRKAGMWPINCKNALEKMTIYQPPELKVEPEYSLPGLRTPTHYHEAEKGMRYWNTTFQEKREQGKPLSSPTTRKFESFSRGTQELLSSSKLTVLQLTQLNTKLKNQQKARIRGGNKTSIQKF
jgi:hypothetical protein